MIIVPIFITELAAYIAQQGQRWSKDRRWLAGFNHDFVKEQKAYLMREGLCEPIARAIALEIDRRAESLTQARNRMSLGKQE